MYSANSQVIPVIGKAGKRFVIKLHPCLSVGTFKPQRFSPKKNNVRQNWFNGEEGMAEDGSGRLKALFLRNKVILISTCNYCQLIKISKVMQSPVLCNSQTDLIFLISNSRQLLVQYSGTLFNDILPFSDPSSYLHVLCLVLMNFQKTHKFSLTCILWDAKKLQL